MSQYSTSLSKPAPNTYSMVSLGCARNLVDSESMVHHMNQIGFELVPEGNNDSIRILNTCSFIQDAIDETEDNIRQLIDQKKADKFKHLAIVGCYMFDHTLWSKLEQVEPSKRNELEITEVLKLYMRAQDLTYSFYDGYWQDMGTFENWMEVSRRLSEGTCRS